MTDQQIQQMLDALQTISEVTDETPDAILDCLVDDVIDRSDANILRSYLDAL